MQIYAFLRKAVNGCKLCQNLAVQLFLSTGK